MESPLEYVPELVYSDDRFGQVAGCTLLFGDGFQWEIRRLDELKALSETVKHADHVVTDLDEILFVSLLRHDGVSMAPVPTRVPFTY